MEENKTKPKELLELFPPEEAFDSDLVADYILYSVLKRDFHCSCPDIGADQLISSMSGVTPRRLWLFDLLLHPVRLVASLGFRLYADRIAARYGQRLQFDEAKKHI